MTAVRVWKECDQDSTPGKKRSPRGKSPNIPSTVSRGGRENADRGGTMTMVSDGSPYRRRNAGSNSGRHNQGRRAKRGGSLTSPSYDDGQDGDLRSLVSGVTPSVQHRRRDEEGGSAGASGVVRSPSPASSLASGVAATAAAGGMWGARGTMPCRPQGGGGGELGLKARPGRKKGLLGTWGHRKPRRDAELADWLETNTNLVNLSPW